MSTAAEKADLAIELSHKWVASLDRSIFGSFATDARLLAVVHAMYDFDVKATGNPDADFGQAMEHSGSVLEMLDTTLAIPLDEKRFTNWSAMAEVFHWWGDNPVYMEYKSRLMYREVNEIRKVFTSLSENPPRLPYYEAGLRDNDFIDRCITDGVDADLAVALMPIEAIGLRKAS